MARTWPAATGWQVREQFGAAFSGTEAAISYVDWSEASQRWRVNLQRVDEQGAQRGASVVLAEGAGGWPGGKLSLATDGARYLACWGFAGQIACALAPVGGGPVVSAFQGTGSAPVLAHRAGRWVLAYANPTGAVALQRLGVDGQAAAAAEIVTGAPDPADGVPHTAPLLTATASGFVLVAGEPMTMRRLDEDLRALGAPVDLGASFWFFGSVVATDGTAVVSLAKPYGATLFVVEGQNVSKRFDLTGDDKTGLDVALASDGATMGAAWSDRTNVHYGVVLHGAGGHLSEQSVAGSAGHVSALVRIGVQSLVATAKGGDFSLGTEIVLAPVRLP